MRRFRKILFRIFYRTSFSLLLLLLLTLIALTPADAVYQAWKSRRLVDIGAIAGTYVLTAVLAVLIYASRLFTNRSVLLGIPKRYIPIEEDDLPGKVTRGVIRGGLERNALIAYLAKPRFEGTTTTTTTTATSVEGASGPASARISALLGTNTDAETRRRAEQYAWSHIEHPGWSSPASRDLPNLQFHTVIQELPDLIEAKAVSLAPLDHETELPDDSIVALLERPLNTGLRDYITRLTHLELINPPSLAAKFLALYEHARFSTQPLAEREFRDLMQIFASILRGMTRLDPAFFPPPRTPDTPDTPTPTTRPRVGMRAQSSTVKRPQPWTGTGTGTGRSTSTFSLPLLSITTTTTTSARTRPPRRVSEDSVPSVSTSSGPHDEAAVDESDDAASLYTAQRGVSVSVLRRDVSRESYYSLRPRGSRVSIASRASRTSVKSRESGLSEASGGSVVVRRGGGDGEREREYTLEIPGL